ncbi:NHLP leader peptide family RiPP precursor [bacterium]|nr:NHLP leader peptide family RiPP precursor [bacterium]MCI0605725.1 NHLP leader peptide family RiPP precursor [bacterium]
MTEKSTFEERAAKLLKRIRTDMNFKQEFLSRPRQILEQTGFEIPKSIQHIKVVEEAADTMYVVIPYERRMRGPGRANKLWEALLSRRPSNGE